MARGEPPAARVAINKCCCQQHPPPDRLSPSLCSARLFARSFILIFSPLLCILCVLYLCLSVFAPVNRLFAQNHGPKLLIVVETLVPFSAKWKGHIYRNDELYHVESLLSTRVLSTFLSTYLESISFSRFRLSIIFVY